MSQCRINEDKLICPYCGKEQIGHEPDEISAHVCFTECEYCDREFEYSVKVTRDYYAFLDAYKSEKACSIREIYQNIITELNDNYFFEKKIPTAELSELMSNPLMTGMDSVVQQAVKEAVGKIAQESVTAPLT